MRVQDAPKTRRNTRGSGGSPYFRPTCRGSDPALDTALSRTFQSRGGGRAQGKWKRPVGPIQRSDRAPCGAMGVGNETPFRRAPRRRRPDTESKLRGGVRARRPDPVSVSPRLRTRYRGRRGVSRFEARARDRPGRERLQVDVGQLVHRHQAHKLCDQDKVADLWARNNNVEAEAK